MKFRLLLPLLLNLLAFSAMAQITVGVRAGYGLSSTSLLPDKGMERKIGSSPLLGCILHYNIDLKFSAGAEVNYYKFSESIINDSSLAPNRGALKNTITTTTEMSYIQVPITGRASIGDKKYRATVSLGPYIGFAFAGKWINAPRVRYFKDLNQNPQPDYPTLDTTYLLNQGRLRNIDLGGIITGGIEYQLTTTDLLYADLRFQLGFVNFYKTGREDQQAFAQSKYLFPSASWRAASFSVGYLKTFKLPKLNFGGNPDAKRAGKQKKAG